MNKSREQFEEWCDDYLSLADGTCRKLRSGDTYRNVSASECWSAWQASREHINRYNLNKKSEDRNG